MTDVSTKEHTTYIPGLDGLRAIAFLFVYVGHAGFGDLVPGGFGVTIFFFLSGYLITTLLRMEMNRSGKISIAQFYLRRTLRIFPPMYLTLIVWIVLAVLGVFVGPVHWQPIALASVYLTNYSGVLRHPFPAEAGIGILWSLSVEEHFYLLFPWLLVLFLRRRRSFEATAPVLAILCFFALAWRLILVSHFHSVPDTTYTHTDTRFDSILFGCLLAISLNPLLDTIPTWIRKHLAGLAVGGLVVLLGCFIYRGSIFRETFRYSIQGIALAPIFLFVLGSPGTWAVRVLEQPFLRFLGRRSYAMYLIHLCVFDAVHVKLGVNLHWAGIISAPLVVGYSCAMWRLVEIPIGKLRKNRRNAREHLDLPHVLSCSN